jgi:hypothetical protein
MPSGNAKPARFLKPNFLLFTTAHAFLQGGKREKTRAFAWLWFLFNPARGTMKNQALNGRVEACFRVPGMAWLSTRMR